MEHGKKQVSAFVDKLQDNEYFEVISLGTKHVQLKGDLQKGDILKCQYRTDYNIVFILKVSGSSKGSHSRSVLKSETKRSTKSNINSKSKNGSRSTSKSGTTCSKSNTFNTRSTNLVQLTAIK
uniref:DUF3850 domain-containing protein n=1 Tax=Strongyloides venezuelensis TaxID=75913 RepID=A0A0K0G3I2_STRVS